MQLRKGHMCRTNIANNTAVRGFGGPQMRFHYSHC
jgi:xanthine dehydrogenase molybdopterin-binding subunit B